MDVKFIEALRKAGSEYGAVADLLDVLRNGLMIDGTGNKAITASGDELQVIQDAILAAECVEFDRNNKEL